MDPEAEFKFINWPDEPIPSDAVPFDIRGVEHGHHGDKCTFETIVEKYGIDDPAVEEIAKLVHAMDFEGGIEAFPEAAGIKMIISGLRFAAASDDEALEIGFKIWEALYAYFKLRELEERYGKELSSLRRTEKYNFLREKVRENLHFY